MRVLFPLVHRGNLGEPDGPDFKIVMRLDIHQYKAMVVYGPRNDCFLRGKGAYSAEIAMENLLRASCEKLAELNVAGDSPL